MNRRDFLATASLAAAGLAATTLPVRAAAAPLLDRNGKRIKLGMDNFAVRVLGLKGRALVDYAAKRALPRATTWLQPHFNRLASL
jgi:hypothetical protein